MLITIPKHHVIRYTPNSPNFQVHRVSRQLDCLAHNVLVLGVSTRPPLHTWTSATVKDEITFPKSNPSKSFVIVAHGSPTLKNHPDIYEFMCQIIYQYTPWQNHPALRVSPRYVRVPHTTLEVLNQLPRVRLRSQRWWISYNLRVIWG